jgi:two-component system, chemotaxis family, protein-glutamate methylesterase/glutaminase
MIKLLVVEDSAVVRDYLVFFLEKDPEIRVIGSVASGEAALDFLLAQKPDAILMDIRLPGIDGLETTRRIMSSAPVPIVACTAGTGSGDMDMAMRALEAGALALLKKPIGLGAPEAESESAAIISALKLMASIKLVKRWSRVAETAIPPAAVALPEPRDLGGFDIAIVAIGASTGGPPAIKRILSGLSPAFPVPILIVQHIAAGFTAGFADWLRDASGMSVHMARGGEIPLPGHVYIAPDDANMRVGPLGELQSSSDEANQRARPSVGVLFRSIAERFGGRAAGVLLTGMGRDGAAELKILADMGALTIAQDEESCIVFGMPAEAIKLGAARYVCPPEMIAALLNSAVEPGRAKEKRDDRPQ